VAKKVRAIVQLQINAGKATPAPPVGPALGQHGVNIMAFVKEYNERTAAQVGTVIPVEITVYEDRSFVFVTKTPPSVELIKKAIALDRGATTPGRGTVGTISRAQVREIAQAKMQDLNATSMEAAEKMIEGTARSMGVAVQG